MVEQHITCFILNLCNVFLVGLRLGKIDFNLIFVPVFADTVLLVNMGAEIVFRDFFDAFLLFFSGEVIRLFCNRLFNECRLRI